MLGDCPRKSGRENAPPRMYAAMGAGYLFPDSAAQIQGDCKETNWTAKVNNMKIFVQNKRKSLIFPTFPQSEKIEPGINFLSSVWRTLCLNRYLVI